MRKCQTTRHLLGETCKKRSTIWVWVRMPHWGSAFGAANLLLEKSLHILQEPKV